MSDLTPPQDNWAKGQSEQYQRDKADLYRQRAQPADKAKAEAPPQKSLGGAVPTWDYKQTKLPDLGGGGGGSGSGWDILWTALADFGGIAGAYGMGGKEAMTAFVHRLAESRNLEQSRKWDKLQKDEDRAFTLKRDDLQRKHESDMLGKKEGAVEKKLADEAIKGIMTRLTSGTPEEQYTKVLAAVQGVGLSESLATKWVNGSVIERIGIVQQLYNLGGSGLASLQSSTAIKGEKLTLSAQRLRQYGYDPTKWSLAKIASTDLQLGRDLDFWNAKKNRLSGALGEAQSRSADARKGTDAEEIRAANEEIRQIRSELEGLKAPGPAEGSTIGSTNAALGGAISNIGNPKDAEEVVGLQKEADRLIGRNDEARTRNLTTKAARSFGQDIAGAGGWEDIGIFDPHFYEGNFEENAIGEPHEGRIQAVRDVAETQGTPYLVDFANSAALIFGSGKTPKELFPNNAKLVKAFNTFNERYMEDGRQKLGEEGYGGILDAVIDHFAEHNSGAHTGIVGAGHLNWPLDPEKQKFLTETRSILRQSAGIDPNQVAARIGALDQGKPFEESVRPFRENLFGDLPQDVLTALNSHTKLVDQPSPFGGIPIQPGGRNKFAPGMIKQQVFDIDRAMQDPIVRGHLVRQANALPYDMGLTLSPEIHGFHQYEFGRTTPGPVVIPEMHARRAKNHLAGQLETLVEAGVLSEGKKKSLFSSLSKQAKAARDSVGLGSAIRPVAEYLPWLQVPDSIVIGVDPNEPPEEAARRSGAFMNRGSSVPGIPGQNIAEYIASSRLRGQGQEAVSASLQATRDRDRMISYDDADRMFDTLSTGYKSASEFYPERLGNPSFATSSGTQIPLRSDVIDIAGAWGAKGTEEPFNVLGTETVADVYRGLRGFFGGRPHRVGDLSTKRSSAFQGVMYMGDNADSFFRSRRLHLMANMVIPPNSPGATELQYFQDNIRKLGAQGVIDVFIGPEGIGGNYDSAFPPGLDTSTWPDIPKDSGEGIAPAHDADYLPASEPNPLVVASDIEGIDASIEAFIDNKETAQGMATWALVTRPDGEQEWQFLNGVKDETTLDKLKTAKERAQTIAAFRGSSPLRRVISDFSDLAFKSTGLPVYTLNERGQIESATVGEGPHIDLYNSMMAIGERYGQGERGVTGMDQKKTWTAAAETIKQEYKEGSIGLHNQIMQGFDSLIDLRAFRFKQSGYSGNPKQREVALEVVQNRERTFVRTVQDLSLSGRLREMEWIHLKPAMQKQIDQTWFDSIDVHLPGHMLAKAHVYVAAQNRVDRQ